MIIKILYLICNYMPCKNIKYDLYNEIDIENGEELNIIVKR
jgi:hypothetical protein